MSKKAKRVPVFLDTKGIKEIPFNEIKMILRGADDLIMSGGRTLLSKLLKGSKEKKIKELELDRNPAYGFYKDLSIEEVKGKIDWIIFNNYLEIEYDYRLPLLVFTAKGWEIEMDTYSSELLSDFDKMLESGHDYFLMTYLKDRSRHMIFMLLDKVEATCDPKYIPILESWEKSDYKKVQKRIRSVIHKLEEHETKRNH
ncbi:MAG: hypothetical protein K8S16_22030 [Bacteroidales bacterium]|nr:hypothetical protein [Bacteroidales bacterium]